MKTITSATDMFNGRVIKWPAPPGESRELPFDFVFTRKGSWFYVNSIREPKHKLVKQQSAVVVGVGERWAIIDSTTGNVVTQSKGKK